MSQLRHFLSTTDLSSQELTALLDRARELKEDPRLGEGVLAGRRIAMVFEKPSTRTRVSFEVAALAMGGAPIALRGDELQLGRGETVEDTARVLSRYVDAVVVRTFAHERLERLAAASSIPVINALTDLLHPCQALADLQTIAENKRKLEGVTLTFVGDGNNVCHSLMLAGAQTGMRVRVACPVGHEPEEDIADKAREIASQTGGSIEIGHDVERLVRGANVLYTDVWASMGQEEEAAERRRRFQGYSIDSATLSLASADCIVMHCLPAHRGEEISAEVLDGPQSVVWDQAENRMHAQKALLEQLLK